MEQIEPIDILLVEDNPLDAELTLRGLKEAQVANHITWVRDGEEALDYVFRRGSYEHRQSRGPRLILLDLKMPKMDGIEVTKRLKEVAETRRIPIVIMTSSSEESDMVNSYELGVNSYIVKPLAFEEFAMVGRQIGIYWLAINRTIN